MQILETIRFEQGEFSNIIFHQNRMNYSRQILFNCKNDINLISKLQNLSNKISDKDIDDIYSLAKKNGALGGKLLGAGGGGFLLFYCRKANQDKLRKALSELREVRFKFDSIGSKIIYCER